MRDHEKKTDTKKKNISLFEKNVRLIFLRNFFFQPPVLLRGISDSQKKNMAAQSVL